MAAPGHALSVVNASGILEDPWPGAAFAEPQELTGRPGVSALPVPAAAGAREQMLSILPEQEQCEDLRLGAAAQPRDGSSACQPFPQ